MNTSWTITKTGLSLMKNVLKPLTKSALKTLRLTTAVSS